MTGVDDQEEEESEEEPAQPTPPMVQEALKAVRTAMEFVMTRDDMVEEIKFLDKFQKKLVHCRFEVFQQSTLHRFFIDQTASTNARAVTTLDEGNETNNETSNNIDDDEE